MSGCRCSQQQEQEERGPLTRTRFGNPYRGDPCLAIVNAVAAAGRDLIAARAAGVPTRGFEAAYRAARAQAQACLGDPPSPSRWLR